MIFVYICEIKSTTPLGWGGFKFEKRSERMVILFLAFITLNQKTQNFLLVRIQPSHLSYFDFILEAIKTIHTIICSTIFLLSWYLKPINSNDAHGQTLTLVSRITNRVPWWLAFQFLHCIGNRVYVKKVYMLKIWLFMKNQQFWSNQANILVT